MRQYAREELSGEEEILGKTVDYRESAGVIRAEVLLEVLEEIGMEREIAVEDDGKGEKTVREDKNSTGKNGGTGDIADGYAHTATASVGDVVEYQIISTLPTITSKATSLTTYTFADTLSEGIRYNRSDVIIEFFRDAGCTDQITAWDEDSGAFEEASASLRPMSRWL